MPVGTESKVCIPDHAPVLHEMPQSGSVAGGRLETIDGHALVCGDKRRLKSAA